MDKLAAKVLAQITTEKIKPTPKWQFLLKDSVTWITFGLSIIVGSLGSAIVIYLIENNGDLLSLQSVLLSVPVFWLLITAFFVFLSYYNFKHTPDGYRFNVVKIFLMSLVTSLILGWGINFSGLAGRINTLLDNIPYYTQIADPRYAVWMRPAEGYLAGYIQTVDTDNSLLVIKDLNQQLWTVQISSAVIKPAVDLTVGNQIKIQGSLSSENTFEASEIRPWAGKMLGNVKGISQIHGK